MVSRMRCEKDWIEVLVRAPISHRAAFVDAACYCLARSMPYTQRMSASVLKSIPPDTVEKSRTRNQDVDVHSPIAAAAASPLPNTQTPRQSQSNKPEHPPSVIQRLMNNPTLFDPIRKPRNPIVLCHGQRLLIELLHSAKTKV